MNQRPTLKLRKITRKQWENKKRSGYADVITDSRWTGWPVGTRTILDMDPKTGATCLIPVEVAD